MVVAVQSMTARALSSLRLPTNKTPSGLSTMERAFGMLSANTAMWNPDGSFMASRWMRLLAA